MPPSSQTIATLVVALERAWDEGSPVAGSDNASRMRTATIAQRRLESIHRRAGSEMKRDARVRDLAKHLVRHLESQPVGPLLRDYEFVAVRLIDAFDLAHGVK
jgi:hypothetical protein